MDELNLKEYGLSLQMTYVGVVQFQGSAYIVYKRVFSGLAKHNLSQVSLSAKTARALHKSRKGKTTSFFWKIEEDLKFLPKWKTTSIL